MVPGGHIRLEFADRGGLDAAVRALGPSARVVDDAGEEDHTLAIPSDGGVKSLRAVLDRLDYEQIEVEGLSVHTPNLDDVFLTLTGHPTAEQEIAR